MKLSKSASDPDFKREFYSSVSRFLAPAGSAVLMSGTRPIGGS